MRVGVPELGTGAPLRVPHMARHKTGESCPAQRGNDKSRCLMKEASGLLRLVDFGTPIPWSEL